MQGSAGESAIVVLLAALKKKEAELKGKTGGRQNMVVYGSDQAHTIIFKGSKILGVEFHEINTVDSDYKLTAKALEAAMAEDERKGKVPFAVVATTGTTSTCVFDPLEEIVEVAKKRNLWLHIDAAYGGAYACLDGYEAKFAGLEGADSYVVNCHKKLLCPFDIAALYLADRNPVLAALGVESEYLRNEASESGAVIDYENWQMPLGRRFRALKLWFVMRRFGTVGMRDHVRNGTVLAERFAGKVKQHDDLELACAVSLSLVCFRWRGEGEGKLVGLVGGGGAGPGAEIKAVLGDKEKLEALIGPAGVGGRRDGVVKELGGVVEKVAREVGKDRAAVAAAVNEVLDDERKHAELLKAVKDTGNCFIIHTKLRGEWCNKYVIRLACGGVEQRGEDVDGAFQVIGGVLAHLKKTREVAKVVV